ncbi:sialin-like [Mytilus edulis]|uniref:sialin-like n=1 Tax=Mytilus edulis TaxID=6550 RepID=UPI0039F00789
MTKAQYNLSETTIDPISVPWWTSSRLGLAILGFFGFINVYALRVNMSVAIVCMVNRTAIQTNSQDQNGNVTKNEVGCGFGLNTSGTSNFEDGEYIWDKTEQGFILGAFFWGYLATQIPGGWLATKFGGKRVFGWSMCMATIATLFTPLAANVNRSGTLLIVLRILVGFSSGAVFPAMHALWGNWAPPMERSKLTAFTYAGAQVGNVITFPLAAVLCKYGFAGGWPSIFYVLGTVNFVWFVLWMLLVSDNPMEHKRISKIEQEYIVMSLAESRHAETGKDLDVPWKSILTSLPVLAIVVSNITSDWGAYTLLTNIPTYMSEVLKLDITSNGLYSALPYVAFWAMINIAGWMADFFRERRFMNTTMTRKIFDSFGKIVPALMLICLGYVDCTTPTLAIVLLILAVSLTGFQYSGYLINHVDIAPPYAGILFGISNSIASVTGFISPSVVGAITNKAQTQDEWQKVFYIAAAIYAFGAVFYLIFGSGELQDWAREKRDLELNVEMEPLKMDEEKPPVDNNVNI